MALAFRSKYSNIFARERCDGLRFPRIVLMISCGGGYGVEEEAYVLVLFEASRLRVHGFVFRFSGAVLRVVCFGFRTPGPGFRMYGGGGDFRIWDLWG